MKKMKWEWIEKRDETKEALREERSNGKRGNVDGTKVNGERTRRRINVFSIQGEND